MTETRVLVVDDHPVFRVGLKVLLEAEPDIEVIGEAANGAEAVNLARSLRPDVVVMDIGMPGMTGTDATRQIVAARPETKVLIITMFDDDSVFDAVKAGALGYLLKGSGPEDTLRAVRSVARGEAVFSPNTARRIASYFSRSTPSAPFPELTEREREVLDCVARGLTNAAIADRLYLSPKTVRNHVSNVFSKMQVANRAEAIVKAREAGVG